MSRWNEFEIRGGGLGRRIAAVENGVHRDPEPGRGEDAGECRDLLLVRMDAARRQ